VKSMLDRLAAGEVLLADGALGSLLMEHGLTLGDCPERFNLERPDLLRRIAGAYCAAGAEILQTNTFGGSPLKLAAYGLAERTEEIQRAAVQAVREALAGRTDVYISGSCGPCGRMLEPYGDLAPSEATAGFERQIRALLAAGIDLLCIETMSDLQEARIAIQAAHAAMHAVSRTVPIMASMTFDATPRGFFTMMGNDIATVAAGLSEAGADVIGSNCGNGMAAMVAIAREFRAVVDLPLIIQSNAGLPELAGDRAVYPESPEFMGRHIEALCAAGVQVIGGCCGTTPEHIRLFREALDART
jgi:5-methyltetrahydrofolate--homocysteine methyltransferase